MEITKDTRWVAQDPMRAGCQTTRTCLDTPVFLCERCRRQFCVAHLRLAAWKVTHVIPKWDDDRFVMRPSEREPQSNMKLVCEDCARALMNWG